MTHPSTPLPLAGSPIVANKTLEHALTPSTKVLTCDGERTAGSLEVGERIITRDYGAVSLRGLITRMPGRPLDMVHIPAHAFGRNRPERPTTVLADQPILIRDMRARMLYGREQAKVAARRLVDGALVRSVKRDPGALVALHFAKPATIYAHGLELVAAGVPTVKARKG